MIGSRNKQLVADGLNDCRSGSASASIDGLQNAWFTASFFPAA